MKSHCRQAKEAYSILGTLSHLRELTTRIYLPTQRSTEKEGGLSREAFRDEATQLFLDFYRRNDQSKLKYLECMKDRFETRSASQVDGQVRHQITVKITRLERDDAPKPLDGGFGVTVLEIPAD